MGMNADGEMFYVDNQGDYVATNRLSHLKPGSWHGHPASLRWREDLTSIDDRPRRVDQTHPHGWALKRPVVETADTAEGRENTTHRSHR